MLYPCPMIFRDDFDPEAPVCPISFEITAVLLGGTPEDRPGFWRAYQRELNFNRQTKFQNYHVYICREHLASLDLEPRDSAYYEENPELH